MLVSCCCCRCHLHTGCVSVLRFFIDANMKNHNRIIAIMFILYSSLLMIVSIHILHWILRKRNTFNCSTIILCVGVCGGGEGMKRHRQIKLISSEIYYPTLKCRCVICALHHCIRNMKRSAHGVACCYVNFTWNRLIASY